jgi:hypothetical protein
MGWFSAFQLDDCTTYAHARAAPCSGVCRWGVPVAIFYFVVSVVMLRRAACPEPCPVPRGRRLRPQRYIRDPHRALGAASHRVQPQILQSDQITPGVGRALFGTSQTAGVTLHTRLPVPIPGEDSGSSSHRRAPPAPGYRDPHPPEGRYVQAVGPPGEPRRPRTSARSWSRSRSGRTPGRFDPKNAAKAGSKRCKAASSHSR